MTSLSAPRRPPRRRRAWVSARVVWMRFQSPCAPHARPAPATTTMPLIAGPGLVELVVVTTKAVAARRTQPTLSTTTDTAIAAVVIRSFALAVRLLSPRASFRTSTMEVGASAACSRRCQTTNRPCDTRRPDERPGTGQHSRSRSRLCEPPCKVADGAVAHRDRGGESPSEIAPLLGMTPNGVSSLAYRAREGLRRAYLRQFTGATPGTLHSGTPVRRRGQSGGNRRRDTSGATPGVAADIGTGSPMGMPPVA
jgi:hypothetical protein